MAPLPLRDVDLRGAELYDLTRGGATLRGADLRGATVTAGSLAGADTRGAKLGAVVFVPR